MDSPLRSTGRSAFLDSLRVPYVVDDGDAETSELRISASTGGASLSWPRFRPAAPRGTLGRYRMDGIPIVAHVLGDGARPGGRGWTKWIPLTDARDRPVSWVWRSDDGSIRLPFDADEAIRTLLTEAYSSVGTARGIATTARRLALAGYYAAKPFVPRRAQIATRRALATVQARRTFPRWPLEDGLHRLSDWLLRRVAEVVGEPVPWIACWPNGRSWSMVLTHDVDTRNGWEHLDRLRDVERALGLVSSWNLVPERSEPQHRYEPDAATLGRLTSEGCEIGVHGLHHDGRDLASRGLLAERLPRMRDAAARWGAVGFRSPATQRVWEWMPLLGFDYDSSYPDTDPFEPLSGGCCSLLPFMNGDMVELPITLPQDHTLFAILGQTDDRVWTRKTGEIRARGGMALALTHPDYAGDPRLVSSYRALLERFHDDPSVWHALPRDVSAWWRRRAASHLEPTGSAWRIVGPADGEGAIAFTSAERTEHRPLRMAS